MSRTGHHEDCGRPNLFWSFTKYRNHNTNRFKKRKKESKPLKGFFSRRTDVGRTGHHDDWLPQFWSFTKYKNHTTNANNEKRKVNLEEDLLAGGTEDCDCLG